MKFSARLQHLVQQRNTRLCVGLDPDCSKLPDSIRRSYHYRSDEERVLAFCKAIIDATRDYCVAYKPNLAFFEALGAQGLAVFEQVMQYIPTTSHLIIADAKRGDIGNTAAHYAKAFFERFHVDAITLSPLMGRETLLPFLEDERKAVFVLTLTSNAGAADYFMQSLQNGMSLSEYIAQDLAVLQESVKGHIGMVIGATQTESMSNVLKRYPKAHLLIPGVGTQGGDVEALNKVLSHHQGIGLVNVSRAISYASSKEDFAEVAQEQAKSYAERFSYVG